MFHNIPPYLHTSIDLVDLCMAKGIKGSSPTEENKPVKTSFAVDSLTMKKLRYIKLMSDNKIEITDMVNDGLQLIIDKWEKKHGPIPV